MKFSRLLGATALLAVSTACFAGAPVLQASKSVTINAPVSVVWATAGDFGAIDNWLAAVAKETLKKGTDNVPGAVRHLAIKGGGYVNEELLDYNAGEHYYKYRILSSVLPISDYHSKLSAKAAGSNKTVVTWASTFKRKDTGPNPASDANDKTATKVINGLYAAGLANLKKVVESK